MVSRDPEARGASHRFSAGISRHLRADPPRRRGFPRPTHALRPILLSSWNRLPPSAVVRTQRSLSGLVGSESAGRPVGELVPNTRLQPIDQTPLARLVAVGPTPESASSRATAAGRLTVEAALDIGRRRTRRTGVQRQFTGHSQGPQGLGRCWRRGFGGGGQCCGRVAVAPRGDAICRGPHWQRRTIVDMLVIIAAVGRRLLPGWRGPPQPGSGRTAGARRGAVHHDHSPRVGSGRPGGGPDQ